MKRAVPLLLLLVALSACSEEKPKPLSEPGERLFPLRGVILSRHVSENTLRIQHEAIDGYMAAMTMDFPVRGATVDQLPPDGSRIEAKLHVTERRFWVTDVAKR